MKKLIPFSLLIACSTSFAATINPSGSQISIDFSSQFNDGTQTITQNYLSGASAAPGSALGSNGDEIWGAPGTARGETFFHWDLTYDPDPFLYGQFSITNASAFDKTFSLGANLLIDPQFAGLGVYGGSVNATVFDSDNNGTAKLTFNNNTGGLDGIYRGQVTGSAGVLALNLLVGGSIECFSTGCSAFGQDTAGLAGGTVVAVPPTSAVGLDGTLVGSLTGLADEIDIDLNFVLGAGDRATFQVYYEIAEVAPVPLPAAFWLFGSAILGCIGWMQRKAVQTA